MDPAQEVSVNEDDGSVTWPVKPESPPSAYDLFYRFKRQKVLELLAVGFSSVDKNTLLNLINTQPGLEFHQDCASRHLIEMYRKHSIRKDLGVLLNEKRHQSRLNELISVAEFSEKMSSGWRACDSVAKSVFYELAEQQEKYYAEQIGDYNKKIQGMLVKKYYRVSDKEKKRKYNEAPLAKKQKAPEKATLSKIIINVDEEESLPSYSTKNETVQPIKMPNLKSMNSSYIMGQDFTKASLFSPGASTINGDYSSRLPSGRINVNYFGTVQPRADWTTQVPCQFQMYDSKGVVSPCACGTGNAPPNVLRDNRVLLGQQVEGYSANSATITNVSSPSTTVNRNIKALMTQKLVTRVKDLENQLLQARIKKLESETSHCRSSQEPLVSPTANIASVGATQYLNVSPCPFFVQDELDPSDMVPSNASEATCLAMLSRSQNHQRCQHMTLQVPRPPTKAQFMSPNYRIGPPGKKQRRFGG